jgi:hypothetical protein
MVQRWDEIFELMIEMRGNKIIFGIFFADVDWNRHDKILRQIIHVKFINLQHLSLCANNLVSI